MVVWRGDEQVGPGGRNCQERRNTRERRWWVVYEETKHRTQTELATGGSRPEQRAIGSTHQTSQRESAIVWRFSKMVQDGVAAAVLVYLENDPERVAPAQRGSAVEGAILT